MKELSAIIGAANAVRFVGIDHEAELLVCFDQAFDHLNAVLDVHVVVSGSVGQKQCAIELVSYFRQIQIGVTGRIFIAGKAVVALRINGIVVAPVRDRGDGGAGLENLRVSQRVERHGCAIAPAPDANAGAIELRILREKLIECGELIFQFDPTELMADGSHKFAVARWRATIIDSEDRESALRHKLMEQPGGTDPILNPHISDQLRGWPAVNIYDQRNLAGERALLGEHEFAVENGSVVGFELEKFRLSQSVIVYAARAPYFLAVSLSV